jgi:beta-glucosidase
LENKNSILPLAAGRYPTIAVIGPNAAAKDLVLGNYSGEPDTIVSLLEGIRTRVGDSARVIYAQGCSLPDERFPPPPDPATDRRLIAEARQVAAQADIIILAIGGNRNTSAEGGDRASLELLGMQNELCDALYTLGKPIITVLNNGRPLCVGHVAEQSEALLECWYLGQENGRAIAAVLFGDYNPGGKLPITVPRTTGQVHAWYNYKPAARRGYLFTDKEPLYCFGYGKSYTSFAYSNLRLENKSISKQESLKVYVDVENTGTRPGDEVAQLYIRDSLSSVTRPVKELKDFKRLHLKPGQKKTVRFILTPDKLALVNDKMLWAVEPGEFIIMAGGSSRNEDLIKTVLTVK